MLFSQVTHKIDRQLFNKTVSEKQTGKGCKGITTGWTHLISMLFCHFAKGTSIPIRDISNGLKYAH